MRGDRKVNPNFISSLQPCCTVEQSTQCFPEQLSVRESRAEGNDVSDHGTMAQDKKRFSVK